MSINNFPIKTKFVSNNKNRTEKKTIMHEKLKKKNTNLYRVNQKSVNYHFSVLMLKTQTYYTFIKSKNEDAKVVANSSEPRILMGWSSGDLYSILVLCKVNNSVIIKGLKKFYL